MDTQAQKHLLVKKKKKKRILNAKVNNQYLMVLCLPFSFEKPSTEIMANKNQKSNYFTKDKTSKMEQK